jgi:hypothetical protein
VMTTIGESRLSSFIRGFEPTWALCFHIVSGVPHGAHTQCDLIRSDPIPNRILIAIPIPPLFLTRSPIVTTKPHQNITSSQCTQCVCVCVCVYELKQKGIEPRSGNILGI